MLKRTQYVEKEIKLGRITDACQRYSLGKSSMRKIAEEAGAVVRIGRCYLIDFTKMDNYIDELIG